MAGGGASLHQIFGRGVQHTMKNGPNGIITRLSSIYCIIGIGKDNHQCFVHVFGK